MVQQISAVITAFILTFLITPLVTRFLFEKHIVDIPGKRKIHKAAKPSLGGIPIFIGYLLASLIWVNLQEWKNIKFILLAQSTIFIIGVRDDLLPLKAIYKLMGQVLAATIAIFLFDVRIASCYGFLGVYEIPEALSYALTYITLIGITNSLNLIDGLDGLAGTIAGIIFLFFGVWFFLAGENINSILAFALLGGILAFLIYNWQPSSIFMGDTGSLLIGLTIAMFTIRFMNVNYSLPDSAFAKFGSTVGVAVCVIVILLVDTLRIIILRLLKRQSPFTPDKSHVHHAISRLGMTHSQTTLILAGVQLLFISLAIIFNQLGDHYIVPGAVLLSILLSVFLDRLIFNRVSGP